MSDVAIAVFGSVARGDYDSISDRDVLLVSDQSTNLRDIRDNFETFGWSCTVYSWKRLETAASRGSLFVQHLKQESKICLDRQNRLNALLNHFSPKVSYKAEIQSAANVLAVLQDMPNSPVGQLWAMDVLAVSFRSLAVAALADEGIYKYSQSEIANSLIRLGMLSRTDAIRLRELRKFKSSYRRGHLTHATTWPKVFSLIDLVDSVFKVGLHARLSKPEYILELALGISQQEGNKFPNWYANSRRVESALWILAAKHPNQRIEVSQRRKNIFRLVQAPTDYAWHFGQGFKALGNDLRELVSYCAI